MRRFLGRLGRLLLVLLIVAAALALWKREEIMRVLAVNTLFDEDKIVSNFSGMDALFLHAPLAIGTAEAVPFASGTITLPEGYDAWITDRNVTSILVLRNGVALHEAYYLGTTPEDLRVSWSVAKSYLSALLGIVMDEGHIASLDAPVTQYAPELEGSAYDGATIRNVLQMQSGVQFNEDYFDYSSDINRMGRVLALGRTMDGFAASLSARNAAPGESWRYVSIDTHILSMVIRGATGRTIVDLMGEKILTPLGLEQQPYYLTDGEGVAFVLGGLNLTTRDYARFGQMVLQDGQWNGRQVVPAEWLAESTVPSATTEPGKRQYGYQWWIPADARPGEFYGHGVYGQYIYIDRATQTVIVRTAADQKFREPEVDQQNLKMLRALAAAPSR